MTKVAILWHMHQPFYQDLATGEHILPWVRLHALKDYYGMVALMREFPEVKATFNLVPSLLVQLESFAADTARDAFLDLGMKPASELNETEAAFIIRNFFHANHARMIGIYPRYAELLARRGGEVGSPSEARAIARRFSTDDLRDLQVWQKLAWIDPYYLDEDARVRSLVAKGSGFTEEDKAILRTVELEILNRVIPEYRQAAERGQVELSASPFYHPILPLLCDTDVYREENPHHRLPRQRFAHPEEAADQLERAAVCLERLFGRRPVGLWPSEGSVSNAMVPLVAAAGFRWMATDEGILGRSTNFGFTRDEAGHVNAPDRLYAPYRVRVGDVEVACGFRDHTLSDRIGFVYSTWEPQAAASDFVARLAEAGRRYSDRTGGQDATVFVILDGENAWEYFEGGGRPFLRALYRELGQHPGLRTVTMSEACAQPRAELQGIYSGSWIDANFYIWIGHADDQRAWSQLSAAWQAIEAAAPHVAPEALASAREELLIAEGSDWFWWYGDDHSSAHDAEFDDLFRRHVRNVYRFLNQPAPEELFASNITTATAPSIQTQPAAYLRPTLDGEETSYFEWLGAGALEIREVAGAMHQTDRRASMVSKVEFGFGPEHLFVRVDSEHAMADLLTAGVECSIKFLTPNNRRFSVLERDGRLHGGFWNRLPDGPVWVEQDARGAAFGAGRILEVGIPLVELAAVAGQTLRFFVALYDRENVELERHPVDRSIEVTVPDERFEARNWSA